MIENHKQRKIFQYGQFKIHYGIQITIKWDLLIFRNQPDFIHMGFPRQL